MRAILPGRPQSQPQALCTACWDGLRLVAYVSGNTAIILNGPGTILQTLLVDNAKSLIAIAIEESSGRVAVCDERQVQIYNAVGRDEGDLRWTHAHEIVLAETSTISCLSWGSDQEILIGGSALWLYHLPMWDTARPIWIQHIANAVVTASFSNDSSLIASHSKHDRILKIWRRLSSELDNTRFDVSYLPHPGAVTGIHWRKPWHAEQALDNLLYTFCADNQVRLWTYSDPHSLSVMQLIATVDTNASIQPRRLSAGSMSRRRYVFILDSRDFSQATEKAIQQSRTKTVDHALEHLVEVANRSPEICVVMDGLGHMSAWGLENAGCKTRKPTIVFNVALVDDVRIKLNFSHEPEADYIHFCSFAGGTNTATLSLLVHAYTGQIDWYESPIADFFDTSTREQRLQLVSSWSGHDLPVDHIGRTSGIDDILSWTDEGQVILWSQTSNGALQRKSQAMLPPGVLAAVLLDAEGHLLCLYQDRLILWKMGSRANSELCTVVLGNSSQPCRLRLLGNVEKEGHPRRFIVEFASSSYELWHVNLASHAKMNGNHKILNRVESIVVDSEDGLLTSISIDVIGSETYALLQESLLLVDGRGDIRALPHQGHTNALRAKSGLVLETGISRPLLTRATAGGLIAMTDQSGQTLTIWNLSQGVYEWVHKFDGPDHIQKMAWTTTTNGQSMLFVSFSFHALVIGQAGYTEHGQQPCWNILQDISLRSFTTNFIGDVSWLPSTDLAIGAGNQIFVLESMCTRTTTDTTTALVTEKTHGMTISRFLNISNSTFAIFHPTCLKNLVIQGQLDEVCKILNLLNEKLKYFAEGDVLDSFLDEDPTSFLQSGASSPSKSPVMPPLLPPVGDIADILKDNLTKSNIEQLDDGARLDLLRLLSAFFEVEKHRKSLDVNGLRYLFILYMTPKDQHLAWKAFVFASQSASQEALMDIISQFHNNKLTWEVARRTGLFVWLEDRVALQTQFENVARSEYTKHEDRNPVDCSLYYLALNKKSVLQGLWRMTIGVREKENTMKLLANNFDETRWRSTALKNAYALLSKRRFEYAAAFFLLGSSLKDAVNVCVNQLNDIQLGIAVCRVWDKDTTQAEEVLQSLLKDLVMPRTMDDDQGRWMAALAYTMMGNPEQAVRAVVRPLSKVVDLKARADLAGRPPRAMSYLANDPHLAILYSSLRAGLEKQGRWTTAVIEQSEEKDFVMRAAKWLTRARLDLLGLQLIRSWEFIDFQKEKVYPAAPTRDIESPAHLRASATTKADPMREKVVPKKPPPTQFVEPTADSLLDSFGF